MSSYTLTPEQQYSNFDKVSAYHQAFQNSKANFSVSHLLDLEDLPNENCAMYANTDPQPGLPTQACTPNLNGNGLTDLDEKTSIRHDNHGHDSLSPHSPGKNSSKSFFLEKLLISWSSFWARLMPRQKGKLVLRGLIQDDMKSLVLYLR